MADGRCGELAAGAASHVTLAHKHGCVTAPIPHQAMAELPVWGLVPNLKRAIPRTALRVLKR